MPKHTIKLCMKMQKAKDGSGEFPTYFAYRQVQDPATGEFTTAMIPSVDKDGNPTFFAQSYRVVFTESAKVLKAKLDTDNKFPYLLLDLEDNEDFSIAVDKDKDGNIRLDKENKKRFVIFLKSAEKYVEAPRRSISFEDAESGTI